jgi:1-acyl-sn-glycerol-3-phosphate acyltransferase
MNRYRENTVYEFRPPRYSPVWAPVLYAVSDCLYLRRKHRVREVQVSGQGQAVPEHYRRGDALLFTPNHSDHADPHVLMHLSRRFRIPIHFMAAREVFEVNWGIQGRFLQRAGVFSIDREGSDLRAIKEALRIMAEGRFPLVLFPEGEIFHLNELLTPLNEGAATIALRTARRPEGTGAGSRQVLLVPTAMRYRYAEDIRPTFGPALDRLEAYLHWPARSHEDPVERIYRFGEAMLGLKEMQWLGHTLSGPLPERVSQFRELLVRGVEESLGRTQGTGPHPERIRRLRGHLRSLILTTPAPPAEVLQAHYQTLDRLYLAVQLYGYPAQYVRTRPSQERLAETILKFQEDIFGEYRVPGWRRVEVCFCEPIDAGAFLAECGGDLKAAVPRLTERVATAVQDALAKP